MAWGGKGRSGIGNTSTLGTWEDWDGLSPNGRQYKNKVTQECRDLSGSDYWQIRKSDFPHDLSDDVYPESDLYNANGSANVKLFSENDKLKAFLQDAFKAAKRRRIDIDELDRLDLALERFKLMISDDNYEYLVNAFESLRRPSYLATLTPEQRRETEAEDLRDWLLSLSLEERHSKYPFLCQREGIPIVDEKRQAFDVDMGKVARKALELLLLAIFIIYVFYIA